MNIPAKTYRLVMEYGLGEPIRVYATNKRGFLQTVVISLVITYSILIGVVWFTRKPLQHLRKG